MVAPGMRRSFAVRRNELKDLVKRGELQQRAVENLELLEAV